MIEFKDRLPQNLGKYVPKAALAVSSVLMLGGTLLQARPINAENQGKSIPNKDNPHSLYIDNPSLVDQAIENLGLNIPSLGELQALSTPTPAALDLRCDPRRFFRRVEFINRHNQIELWTINSLDIGDRDQGNNPVLDGSTVYVCREGQYLTEFQLDGRTGVHPPGDFYVDGLPVIEVSLNRAHVPRLAQPRGGVFFPEGGQTLNDLDDLRNLNKRTIISSTDISDIQIGSSTTTRLVNYNNQECQLKSLDTAVDISQRGDRMLCPDARGSFSSGAWVKIDGFQTASPTATVTRTLTPSPTFTPSPTAPVFSPTPDRTPTPGTNMAGRNFGISTRPGMVTTSWIGEGGGGSADLSYALLRIDQNGTTILPRTGAIPSTISIYSDTETVNSSFRCYTLVLLNRGTPSGNSDVLCALPTTASGIFASDFTYRLNQSNTAYLSWGNTPGIESNAIVPLGRESILGTGNSAFVDTRGVLLCVTLVGLTNSQPTGNTTVLCGLPGLSHLP